MGVPGVVEIVGTITPLLVDEQEVVNARGMQIGNKQQLLITQTVLLVGHVFVLEQASNNEQETWGAHKVVFFDV